MALQINGNGYGTATELGCVATVADNVKSASESLDRIHAILDSLSTRIDGDFPTTCGEEKCPPNGLFQSTQVVMQSAHKAADRLEKLLNTVGY